MDQNHHQNHHPHHIMIMTHLFPTQILIMADYSPLIMAHPITITIMVHPHQITITAHLPTITYPLRTIMAHLHRTMIMAAVHRVDVHVGEQPIVLVEEIAVEEIVAVLLIDMINAKSTNLPIIFPSFRPLNKLSTIPHDYLKTE